MIADQVIGKSFLGALNYNLKKLYHPDPKMRAELLDNNFASIDSKMIQQELRLVRGLRPNLNKYVYHTSLNFSKEDILDNDKLLAIAQDYLRESGYTNNQYMIFRHYDADHPHIHLLVNRITFDGEVVSDSNNYKKSEAILRKLEYQYNLIAVEPSHNVPERAATKNELEMVLRTGRASEKMLLQELMKRLLSQHPMNIQDMINKGEEAGIHFLFNQASTGRVTGITYFHDGFKIKGQALGNQFKWAEIIKKVGYEQIRDSEATSQANNRTTAKYGKQTAASDHTTADRRHRSGADMVSENSARGSFEFGESRTAIDDFITNGDQFGSQDGSNEERSLEANKDVNIMDNGSPVDEYDSFGNSINIQISDDIDDEAIHGRNRHRQRKATTNTR